MFSDKTLKRCRAALAAKDHAGLADLFGLTTPREGLFAAASYIRAADGASPEERATGRAWLTERGLAVPKSA